MDIGRLVDKKIWLAPLAGYTDISFRSLCKIHGADVLVSEMVSAEGLVRRQKRTLEYLKFSLFEKPFGVQIFGSNPEIMSEAAKIACEFEVDFIDINMGCPVKKVCNRGAGAALMKTPIKASEIISKMKKVTESFGIPLSTKIRSGWDEKSVNAIKFSKMVEENGSDIVILHPRTKERMFSGHSDWDLIKEMKSLLNIPVVGNGDINSPEKARKMYDYTKCDSVMIGRGAVGYPWIFEEIKNLLEKGYYIEKSSKEKGDIIREHIESVIEEKGEKRTLITIRSHMHQYIKGIEGAAKAREKLNHCKAISELYEILESFFR